MTAFRAVFPRYACAAGSTAPTQASTSTMRPARASAAARTLSRRCGATVVAARSRNRRVPDRVSKQFLPDPPSSPERVVRTCMPHLAGSAGLPKRTGALIRRLAGSLAWKELPAPDKADGTRRPAGRERTRDFFRWGWAESRWQRPSCSPVAIPRRCLVGLKGRSTPPCRERRRYGARNVRSSPRTARPQR